MASKVYELLRDYISWGLAVFIGLAALLLSKDKLITIYHEDMYAGLLSSALMVISAAWFFTYMRVSRHELDLLEGTFIADKLPTTRGAVLPIAVLVSGTFAVLIAYSTDPLVYSAMACVFCFADLWGLTTATRTIGALISAEDYAPEQAQRVRVLHEYYIERPHTIRVAGLMLAFVAALVLSILCRLQNLGRINYAVYGLLIVPPIITETVLVRWRHIRDSKLLAAEQQPPPKKRRRKATGL